MICINCGTQYNGSLSIWLHGIFSDVSKFFSTSFRVSNHPKLWAQYPSKRYKYLNEFFKFHNEGSVLRKLGIDIKQGDWVSKIENREDLYLCNLCAGEVGTYERKVNDLAAKQAEEKKLQKEKEEKEEKLQKDIEESASKLFNEEPTMKDKYTWLQNNVGKRMICITYYDHKGTYSHREQNEATLSKPRYYFWNREQGIEWELIDSNGYLNTSRIDMPCENKYTIRSFSMIKNTLKYSEGRFDTEEYATLASNLGEIKYYAVVEITPKS